MIAYFKNKNYKSKTKHEKHKMLCTIIKSFDSIVTIATTSSFVTLSLTGVNVIAIPISSSIACGLAISYKVKYEINMEKKY